MDSKLRNTIATALRIKENEITRETSTGNEPRWDSLRHMNLVFALEDAFGVRFSDEEIPMLTSVGAIEEAMAKRV